MSDFLVSSEFDKIADDEVTDEESLSGDRLSFLSERSASITLSLRLVGLLDRSCFRRTRSDVCSQSR